MGIKGNQWAARLAVISLLVAICTVPQTPSSQAVNRCQALETIAFSSYSGTVGSAKIALTNYKNCLDQQYGSSKASLVPCARYHQIASAFVVLSSSSQYLTKALVDYSWCVTGEKSIYESKALTSCDAYLDVVRIALAAGDVALASFARDASSDCQTRTLVSAPTPTPTSTPSKSPTPSPTSTPPALLEMPLPPLPSVSGEVQIGKTVTLVWSSPISGYDSITYLWRQICTSSTNCRGSLEIPGATQSSYTIQSKDAGYGISVNILFKKAGYKNYERFLQISSSVPTPTPTKKINFPTLPKATIVGNTFEGGGLQITFSSSWPEGVTLTYQWSKRCILIQCPVGVGRDYQPILAATSSNYQTLPLDGGHQIQAVIVASKSGYNDGTVYTSFPPTLITGEPAVSGVLKEGNGLQGHTGLWPEGYSLEYRWIQSCKNGDGGVSDCYSTIPSARSLTLSITAAQVNKSLGFVVKGTKAGNPTIERYSRSYGTVVNKYANTAVFIPTPPQPVPTAKPTSGIITQPSPMPAPTPSSVITQPSLAPVPNSGVDCTSNPSPLCGGSVAPSSPSTIPAPTPIAAPATSFVEVLCFETYPASNNPKTPVTATIATRMVESLADSQSCPMGMTRKINQKPVFAEAGIFLSSDKKQINYSPAKDNSAGAGNRLERFFACNTQISMSPKRPDIPKTTTTISRTLGDDELNCPKGSTFVATVFYYGYKTIKGQGYGGLAGQWPSWTYSSQPTKQKTSFGGKCAFVGQVGFWESSEKHVLVCRPDAKSGQLIWTQ